MKDEISFRGMSRGNVTGGVFTSRPEPSRHSPNSSIRKSCRSSSTSRTCDTPRVNEPLVQICLDKSRGFQRKVRAGATSAQAGPHQDNVEGIRPSGVVARELLPEHARSERLWAWGGGGGGHRSRPQQLELLLQRHPPGRCGRASARWVGRCRRVGQVACPDCLHVACFSHNPR